MLYKVLDCVHLLRANSQDFRHSRLCQFLFRLFCRLQPFHFTDVPSKLQNFSLNRWRPEYPEEAFLLPRKVFQQELWKYRKARTSSKNNHHDQKQVKSKEWVRTSDDFAGSLSPSLGPRCLSSCQSRKLSSGGERGGRLSQSGEFSDVLISFVKLCSYGNGTVRIGQQ